MSLRLMEDKGASGNSHSDTSLDPTYSDHSRHCNKEDQQAHITHFDVLDVVGKLGNTPEVTSSNVYKISQEPLADTKYLVLLDDEGKLGNPRYVAPLNVDTQESPADNTYLVLLDDEGKLGNPPEVERPNVGKNSQEPPADKKYLVLLDDEGNLGNT